MKAVPKITSQHNGISEDREPGKDAFHRVPSLARNEWDAVERVLTAPGGKFTGREKTSGAAPGCAAN